MREIARDCRDSRSSTYKKRIEDHIPENKMTGGCALSHGDAAALRRLPLSGSKAMQCVARCATARCQAAQVHMHNSNHAHLAFASRIRPNFALSLHRDIRVQQPNVAGGVAAVARREA